jgi:hypothetical protein
VLVIASCDHELFASGQQSDIAAMSDKSSSPQDAATSTLQAFAPGHERDHHPQRSRDRSANKRDELPMFTSLMEKSSRPNPKFEVRNPKLKRLTRVG